MTVPSLTLHLPFSVFLLPTPLTVLINNRKNPPWLVETDKEFSEKLLQALRITRKANEVVLEDREGPGELSSYKHGDTAAIAAGHWTLQLAPLLQDTASGTSATTVSSCLASLHH